MTIFCQLITLNEALENEEITYKEYDKRRNQIIKQVMYDDTRNYLLFNA